MAHSPNLCGLNNAGVSLLSPQSIGAKRCPNSIVAGPGFLLLLNSPDITVAEPSSLQVDTEFYDVRASYVPDSDPIRFSSLTTVLLDP